MKEYYLFLEFLCRNINLNETSINILWSEFVINPNCPEEMNQFFNFIGKHERNNEAYIFTNISQYKSTIISEKDCGIILRDFFLNPKRFGPELFNYEAFNCFKICMIRYNIYIGSIKIIRGALAYQKIDIYGIEMIWHIAFACKDPKTKSYCADFICSIYINIYQEKNGKFPNILETFVDFALDEALAIPIQNENVSYLLKLLTQFIS